jgi:hypothetical protein
LAFVYGGTGSRVEGNRVSANADGIAYDGAGGDLGGGEAGSAGGNVISCNRGNDLWVQEGVAVSAMGNAWDHLPPSQGCYYGDDVCLHGSASVVTTDATLAQGACP